MNNHRSAKSFLKDSELLRSEAEQSFKEGHYHRVVRKCQEACELAVKGLFKEIGIDYPKSHRLGPVISRELKKHLKVAFEEIDRLNVYTDSLALERELSFYGDPDGTPAVELFNREDAQEALQKVDWVLSFIKSKVGS